MLTYIALIFITLVLSHNRPYYRVHNSIKHVLEQIIISAFAFAADIAGHYRYWDLDIEPQGAGWNVTAQCVTPLWWGYSIYYERQNKEPAYRAIWADIETSVGRISLFRCDYGPRF